MAAPNSRRISDEGVDGIRETLVVLVGHATMIAVTRVIFQPESLAAFMCGILSMPVSASVGGAFIPGFFRNPVFPRPGPPPFASPRRILILLPHLICHAAGGAHSAICKKRFGSS